MVATTGGMNGLDALLAMYGGGGQGFGGFGGGMSPFGFGGGYMPMLWPGMGGGFGAQSGVGAQGGGQPMPYGGNPFAALMMAAQQQQGGGQPLPGGMGAMPRSGVPGSPGGVASTAPGSPATGTASSGLMNPSAGGSVGTSNAGPSSPPTSLAQPMPAPAGNPLNRNFNGASLMADGGRAGGGEAFERILAMVGKARAQPRSIAEIMASYGRG